MIWLLDTNAVVHALNGLESVRTRLNALRDDDRVVTSTIVLAELIYGAECSARRDHNRRNVYEKMSGSSSSRSRAPWRTASAY